MAHVDQDIFKKIIKEYKSVKNEYKECVEDYSCNWNFENIGIALFWFLVDSSNSVYVHAKKLKTEIDNMLETIKFENEKNKEKYEKMSEKCQEISKDIKEKFDVMLQSYGKLIDNEKASIEILEIY